MIRVQRATRVFSLAVLAFVWAAAASAGPTPEQKCQSATVKAGGAYAKCEANAQGNFFKRPGEDGKFHTATSKCREKYGATWDKNDGKFVATSCNAPRYVDNANGTVTDNQTHLTWEQKTDDSTVHDKDNFYTWSTLSGDVPPDATDADGSVFIFGFLSTLNSDPCFAGHCDWRLPSVAELQTILLQETYPCVTIPCINATLFGPTPSVDYWSSTTDADPTLAWGVYFGTGHVGKYYKPSGFYARAVRGGS